MSETVAGTEFRAWEAHQQLGSPLSTAARCACQMPIKGRRGLSERGRWPRGCWPIRLTADAWMGAPQVDLGGLEPEALAADP